MASEFESMPDWPLLTVDEAKAPGRSVVSGPFGSNIGSRFFVTEGVPVIRGNNLTAGSKKFVDSGFVYLTEVKAEEFPNCVAVRGDLVFTAAGTIGQVGIIPEDSKYERYIISNKQLRVRFDESRVLPMFAFYWFSTPAMIQLIQSCNTGSTVPLINLSVLKSLPIPAPDKGDQEAVVATLSSLDGRIDCLTAESRSLESIVRAIFKSWFVDFDPVRAKAEGSEPEGMDAATAALFSCEFKESGVGLIPEGWYEGALGDIGGVARLGAQKADMLPGENYVGLEHIPRESWALPSWGKAADLQSGKSRFQTGDILFGKLRPYFHKVSVAPIDGVCSTDILVVRPRAPEWFGFVLCHVSSKELIDYATRLSNGAKMPRTSWHDLKAYKLVIPPESLAESFTRLVRPIIERIVANVHVAAGLAELRDTLLPRLISGKLRVPEAAKQLEAVL